MNILVLFFCSEPKVQLHEEQSSHFWYLNSFFTCILFSFWLWSWMILLYRCNSSGFTFDLLFCSCWLFVLACVLIVFSSSCSARCFCFRFLISRLVLIVRCSCRRHNFFWCFKETQSPPAVFSDRRAFRLKLLPLRDHALMACCGSTDVLSPLVPSVSAWALTPPPHLTPRPCGISMKPHHPISSSHSFLWL